MKRILVPGLLALLLTSMSLTAPSKAAVVWSDNFDDGNLDGWTISGATPFNAKGNFSAADKTLRETSTPKQGGFSLITHPTMVVTGTWSFDLYFNGENNINTQTGVIDFLVNPVTKLPNDWNCYEIIINYAGTVSFYRIDGGNFVGPYLPSEESGLSFRFNAHQGSWTHIDVTRDANGRFCLYANGTLSMDIMNTKYTSFSHIGLWLQPGPAIDNVVVRDTIYVPPGSLRVAVKDSGGNALSGAAVYSSKQPSGQTTLSGTTAADGTVTFTGLDVGNYTLQVSKAGYVSGSAQGAVASGAKTELSSTLQAQPSSGIPGFPFSSVIVGVLLCTAWYWLHKRRPRTRLCIGWDSG